MSGKRSTEAVKKSHAGTRNIETRGALTLSDVAEAAGVTLSTASRSINGAYGVHPKTRERVLAAAELLQYKPNRVARGLATGQSHSLGLIVSDIRNPYFAEVARGVQDAAFEAGRDVILCNTDLDVEKHLRFFDSLLEKRVDGVIMNFVNGPSRELKQLVSAPRVPVVLINRPRGLKGFSTVTPNNRKGGQLAAKCLLHAGHRHLVHLTGPAQHPSLAHRATGFMEAIRHFGFKAEASIVRGAQTFAGGYEMGRELFRDRGQVTAVFAGSDTMALGILKAANEMRIKVPEDVSIVGFDDIDMAALSYPALTTIRQPKYETGFIAAQMLISQISGGFTADQHRVLDVELVQRGSVARPHTRPTT